MKKLTLILTYIFLFAANAWSQSSEAGAAYCGPYTESKPITISGKDGLRLQGLKIEGAKGNGITLRNCSNVIIENCKFDSAEGNGIELFNCSNVTIKNCVMQDIATGVYAIKCQKVSVEHISVKNVTGPYPRGQMVQFNEVTGPDNCIVDNLILNEADKSYAEDAINLYKSYGTEQSPILVARNYIQGGGPSESGGGIMIGDNGGAYAMVEENVLVDPGQYGIGISSGTNVTVQNNVVVGKQQPFTNVGIYAWNQYDTPCNSLTICNNEVDWLNADGVENSFWQHDNVGEIEGVSTNDWEYDGNSALDEFKAFNDCW
ncbi:MAG: right-handed parallel beta-helix repeat-containing protein [Leeuwenhoekiella sp.]